MTCALYPSLSFVILIFFFFFFFSFEVHSARTFPLEDVDDPIKGFIGMPLNESNFAIHKPYNLQIEDRYSFINGVHKFWVYATDMPLSKSSLTNPRSEARIVGYDYTNGTWQFEGLAYVPEGTTGVCIMQIFGAVGHPTTLMLKFVNCSLYYYLESPPLTSSPTCNIWFQVNVIHYADAGTLQIFINRKLVKEVHDRTYSLHWFQFGTYEQENHSDYMETRWKDIKVLKKIDR